MTEQPQRVPADVFASGSSTYGAHRTKLPRLPVRCETSPFTSHPSRHVWSSNPGPTSGAMGALGTVGEVRVCVVRSEGTLPALQKALCAPRSAVQFERFDAFLVAAGEYWSADARCILQINVPEASDQLVLLEGPDGSFNAPAVALDELSMAHAEYEEGVRAAEKEEADDWLFAD